MEIKNHNTEFLWIFVKEENSLCGSVGKDFVKHACGHELKSR